ncbi:hypothetical protein CB172_02250 [Salmonella enterica subsp. enterica serovar Claibornei]|nr:hypothetical protein [Salmonella enterica subsp. enterica serovar Claibornei]
MMENIKYISLSLIHDIGASNINSSESYVYIHNKKTEISIPVQRLEAAILLDDGRYLLFATDDTPFEEPLEIFLIELHEGVQEWISLSLIYGTGTFHNLKLYESFIDFSYFKDEVWRINVTESRQFIFPSYSRGIISRHSTRFKSFIDIKLISI